MSTPQPELRRRWTAALQGDLRKLAALSLLGLACGEPGELGASNGAPASDGQDGELVDATRCDDCEADELGGETSEFGGADMPYCPEMTTTPVELSSDEAQSMAAVAEGEHRLSLLWISVDGTEESTELTLRVRAVAARLATFGSGGFPDGGGCDGAQTTQLELELAFETADGSLDASFRQWFEGDRAECRHIGCGDWEPDGTHLWTAESFPDNIWRKLDEVTGTLGFGLEPEKLAASRVVARLRFGEHEPRGHLFARPWPDGAAPAGDEIWAPRGARFPADPCGYWSSPIDLDEAAAVPGGSARGAAAQIASHLEALGEVDAEWTDFRSRLFGTENPSAEPTCVALRLGEPSHACRIGADVQLMAPLGIESADGRVSLSLPVNSRVSRSSRLYASLNAQTPRMTVAELTALGLPGLDLGDAERGWIEVDADVGSPVTYGSLRVRSRTDAGAGYDGPELYWSTESECQR